MKESTEALESSSGEASWSAITAGDQRSAFASRLNHVLLIMLVGAWSTWQFLLALGAVPADSLGPWHTAIQLVLASLVIAGFAQHSAEVRAVGPVQRAGTWVASTVVIAAAVTSSLMTGHAAPPPVVAGLGLVALLVLVHNSLGRPIALAGAAIYLTGLGFYAISEPADHDKLASLVQQTWSDKGVFGDGLFVSATYLFVFLGLGSLLSRSGMFRGLRPRGRPGLRGARVDGQPRSLLEVLLDGTLAGATSAALDVRSGRTDAGPLPSEGSGLDRVEQGALLAVASSFSQLMPPILSAGAFLISLALDVPFIQVLVALLIPAFLAGAGLMYYSRAATWRQEVVDTPAESARFIAGVAGMLLVCAGFAMLAWGAVASPMEIRLSAASAYGLAAGALLLQVMLSLWCRYHDVPDHVRIARLSRSSWGVLGIFLLLLFSFPQRPELAAGIAFAYGLLLHATRAGIPLRDGARAAPMSVRRATRSLVRELVATCRVMAMVAVALAFVGIVVAPVTLMGIGPVLTDVVTLISMGNLLLVLAVTALLTLLAGMAFNTTATYLLVATVMVPIIAAVGAEGGVLPALIALHVFVLFFAVASDITPPDDIAVEGIGHAYGLDKQRLRLRALTVASPLIVLPFAFVGRDELFLLPGAAWQDVLLAVLAVGAGLIVLVHVALRHFLRPLSAVRAFVLLLIALALILPPDVLKSASMTDKVLRDGLPEAIAEERTESRTITLDFDDPLSESSGSTRLDVQVVEGGSVADALREAGVSTISTLDGGVYVADVLRSGQFGPKRVTEGMRLTGVRSTSARFDYRAIYVAALLALAAVIATTGGAGPRRGRRVV